MLGDNRRVMATRIVFPCSVIDRGRWEPPRRERFWDAARLRVLLALRAGRRDETAGDLAECLQRYHARSSVVIAVNTLMADDLVVASPAAVGADLAAIEAMLQDQDPPERIVRLSTSGRLVADLLLLALRETLRRSGGQCGHWDARTIRTFLAARPQRAAQVAMRQGYPHAALSHATRAVIHRTVVLLQRHRPDRHWASSVPPPAWRHRSAPP